MGATAVASSRAADQTSPLKEEEEAAPTVAVMEGKRQGTGPRLLLLPLPPSSPPALVRESDAAEDDSPPLAPIALAPLPLSPSSLIIVEEPPSLPPVDDADSVVNGLTEGIQIAAETSSISVGRAIVGDASVQ